MALGVSKYRNWAVKWFWNLLITPKWSAPALVLYIYFFSTGLQVNFNFNVVGASSLMRVLIFYFASFTWSWFFVFWISFNLLSCLHSSSTSAPVLHFTLVIPNQSPGNSPAGIKASTGCFLITETKLCTSKISLQFLLILQCSIKLILDPHSVLKMPNIRIGITQKYLRFSCLRCPILRSSWHLTREILLNDGFEPLLLTKPWLQ